MYWNFCFPTRDWLSLIFKILIPLGVKHCVEQSDTISCHSSVIKVLLETKQTLLWLLLFCTLCSWILIYLFIRLYRRINIGSRFQADIPELQDRLLMEKDVHKATLVWKPWPELENKVFQQRGTMSCHFRSSYVNLCLLKKVTLISHVYTVQNVQESINYWECTTGDQNCMS